MREVRYPVLIKRPVLAATISCLGGALILLGASLALLTSKGGAIDYSSFLALSLGISVTVAAVFLYYRPLSHKRLSLVILLFSIISLIGTGDFLTGAFVGAIGGLLAIFRVS